MLLSWYSFCDFAREVGGDKGGLDCQLQTEKEMSNNLRNDQSKESTAFSMEVCMHLLVSERENSSNHFNYTSLVTWNKSI